MRNPLRLVTIRLVTVLMVLLGLNYVGWRWLYSVHWAVWWIAVPLVLAETYSFLDSALFGLTMWRLRLRPEPPPAPAGLSVDVFITTYDEPLDLVLATARAALAIRYPHSTWVLDDGNRTELQALLQAEGIGWVPRSADWQDRPRHAKAGNLNNALLATDGEFLLILDADQVPDSRILDRTLGYFQDERLALVQTPQYFINVPADDPLGSQAPLFYGPIQQGKDGWNAAFFCGSNAVLRREALMQLGVAGYVSEVEAGVTRALRTADRVLQQAIAATDADDARTIEALEQVRHEVRHARSELRRGHPLAEVTYRFQRRITMLSRTLVEQDANALQADLAAIAGLGQHPEAGSAAAVLLEDSALDRLAHRDWSPLGAIETVRALITAVDVDRGSEAQAIMPLATISVTEDMATSMRLHAAGWKSAYHHEVLAYGLAPEELASMLTQRLRWAQGTIQVMLRENPLVQRGLSVAQRLMYFSTMWSYLSGFAAVVYVAAPVLYLTVGVLPVQTYSVDFFSRLIPFLIANQLLFLIVGRGSKTWRGQQYSLALFPIWIRAVTTAVGNVLFGRSLGFAVTPKTRQDTPAPPWRLIRAQLWVMALLVFAIVIGLIRLAVGQSMVLGTVTNVAWAAFDLLIFSVLIRAARYRGYPADAPASPARSELSPSHLEVATDVRTDRDDHRDRG